MQVEPHGITAALLCLHMKSETARRGREGVGVSTRCVQITRCAWCAWCAPTIPITPSPSQLHADGMWIGREGGREEREEGQLTHALSLHRTSSRHTPPPLISSPSSLFPPPYLSSTPTTHTHTITSTSLLPQLNPPHTHVPNLSQCTCQCTEETQQQHSSSTPTTRVPHHHQQPMSSSTCMPHL